MINLEVYSTHAVIRSQQPLTVGLTGAKAHFTFDETWEWLVKTAVFRQGEKTVTVTDIGEQVELPWEVLTLPGVPVMIGIYGKDTEGKLAIPTIWAETEPVRPGADPDQGVSPAEPTPSVWAQLQGHMGSLEQLQTNDKTSLVAAINEANRAVCLVKVSKEEDGTYAIDTNIPALLNAYSDGKTLICDFSGALMHLTSYSSTGLFEFTSIKNNTKFCVTILPDGSVTYTNTVFATNQSKLPNPKKLTFIGNATAEYDGSEAMTIGIPTKLSQLQNDSGFLTEAPAPVYLVTFDASKKAEQSYADRLAAYQSGYVIQCDYLGARLPLKAVVDMDFMFSGTIDGTSYHVVVRSNGSTVINERSLASKSDIPTKLSQLQNDSGFLTEAPVTSVNGQIGDVTLPTTVKVELLTNEDGSLSSSITSANIAVAYGKGNTVYCQHDTFHILPLLYVTPGKCVFGCVYDDRMHTVTVSGYSAEVNATPVSGGADSLYLDQTTGMLYLMGNGQIIGNGVQLPTAEGEPTNNAVLTLENTTGWSEKIISMDADCVISYRWSSVEGGVSTGSGTVVLKVGNELQHSETVAQGECTLNISSYLSIGENLIHLTVTDFYGNSKTVLFGVKTYDPAALKSTRLVERTLTGDYINDRVTKVGRYAFRGLTLNRLSLPNVTEVESYAMMNLVADEVDLPSLVSIENAYWVFRASKIGVVNLPSVKTVGSESLWDTAEIGRIVFNSLEAIGVSFKSGNNIKIYDFHVLTSLKSLPHHGKQYSIIIRTPTVCTLQDAPASYVLPYASLYVPRDLVDSYKAATNWSSIADRIFAIEDYPEIDGGE